MQISMRSEVKDVYTPWMHRQYATPAKKSYSPIGSRRVSARGSSIISFQTIAPYTVKASSPRNIEFIVCSSECIVKTWHWIYCCQLREQPSMLIGKQYPPNPGTTEGDTPLNANCIKRLEVQEEYRGHWEWQFCRIRSLPRSLSVPHVDLLSRPFENFMCVWDESSVRWTQDVYLKRKLWRQGCV